MTNFVGEVKGPGGAGNNRNIVQTLARHVQDKVEIVCGGAVGGGSLYIPNGLRPRVGGGSFGKEFGQKTFDIDHGNSK